MLTITDRFGKAHTVMAAKPKTAHPGDAHLWVVIHESHGYGHPLVVHDFNTDDGGFYNGSYCTDMIVARAVFNER